MKDVGLLLLRIVSGGLMMGHGAQKLFGAFGGHGLKGTAEWMEGMGLRPGEQWALLAGGSEFGGGLLTLTGFLNPVGSIGIAGAMGMATAKVHWGKPIWVTSGGAEYPLTNTAIALAVGMMRPGKYSLDNELHIHLPRRLILIPGLVAAASAVIMGALVSKQRQEREAARSQREQPTQQTQQPQQEQQEAVPVPETPTVAAAATATAEAANTTVPEPPEMPTERDIENEQPAPEQQS